MPCARLSVSIMDPRLSEKARNILRRMQPKRSYEASELRALVPDTTVESLREIMQELWVNRYVERAGYSGWRVERSTSGSNERLAIDDSAGYQFGGSRGHNLSSSQTKAVRPEDLFDHDSFSEFFK
jgi:hypothetical protein